MPGVWGIAKMANVNWINGEVNPPESGEYYVILEAQQDMKDPDTGEILRHAGDFEVTGDRYDTNDGCFVTIGKKNPWWRVVAWAEAMKPSVPEEIRPRVKAYFGQEVNLNG